MKRSTFFASITALIGAAFSGWYPNKESRSHFLWDEWDELMEFKEKHNVTTGLPFPSRSSFAYDTRLVVLLGQAQRADLQELEEMCIEELDARGINLNNPFGPFKEFGVENL